jgi:hypothetical protein
MAGMGNEEIVGLLKEIVRNQEKQMERQAKYGRLLRWMMLALAIMLAIYLVASFISTRH